MLRFTSKFLWRFSRLLVYGKMKVRGAKKAWKCAKICFTFFATYARWGVLTYMEKENSTRVDLTGVYCSHSDFCCKRSGLEHCIPAAVQQTQTTKITQQTLSDILVFRE